MAITSVYVYLKWINWRSCCYSDLLHGFSVSNILGFIFCRSVIDSFHYLIINWCNSSGLHNSLCYLVKEVFVWSWCSFCRCYYEDWGGAKWKYFCYMFLYLDMPWSLVVCFFLVFVILPCL